MATSRQQPIDKEGNPLLTDFGVVYPTGHIVAAFEKDEDAQKVCDDLITGSYQPSERQIATPEFATEAAKRNINSAGLLARIGFSMKFVESYLETAKRGATFVLIYAPNLLDVERVKWVVPFILAHHYTRLAIEDIKDDSTGTSVLDGGSGR
jgi:hypothetical protein